MNDRLQSTLKQLRLSGLAETLDVRLQEAAGHQLTHAEFLELILQDELHVREERLIGRRVKAASFKELKPLDDFDWAFNPSIPRKQIFDLATCRFVRESRDVLLMGPPGVGKSLWSKRSGIRRSSKASSSCTGRSSTWCVTSCTTKRSTGRRRRLQSISNRIC